MAAAASATKDEEEKKGKRKDLTTAFEEGRAAEVEVLKNRLQFDIDSRREEAELKRCKLESEEKRFEREDQWRREGVLDVSGAILHKHLIHTSILGQMFPQIEEAKS
jgi:hypothetical protein